MSEIVSEDGKIRISDPHNLMDLKDKDMDIYSEKGTKVVYSAHPHCGSEYDRKEAKKHLKKGNVYTIERTDVYGFHTDVFLQEVPDISFNSVLFIPFEEPTNETS